MRGGTEVHGGDVAEAVGLLLRAPETDIVGKAFNCSDIYVSTRDIAACVREHSGRDLALPDEPAGRAGFNVMDCSRLQALGMTFGSSERLEQTIRMLTDIHPESAA